MATEDVIYISDDDEQATTMRSAAHPTAASTASAALHADDSDSDVKTEDDALIAAVTSSSHANRKRTSPTSSSTSPSALTTSSGKRMRRSSPASRDKRDTYSGAGIKPLTPSATVNSSMNASLVFDMVTSLSTNDPGAAIATLRSIVVLGKEYPSNLLYDELLDRIQSVEAVAYKDAVSIYASLVFVFDKAAACSCAVSFPDKWEPLAAALQDAATLALDATDAWRRSLLVVQFYVYCLAQDVAACRMQYATAEPNAWIQRTRVFLLLQSDAAGAGSGSRTTSNSGRNAKRQTRNNVLLQAVGHALQLWQRVLDGEDPKTATKRRHEGEDACLAVVRLIEMLYLCTNQIENVLQRIQAGVMDLTRPTRMRFAHALQSPDLKVRVATTVMGLTNKTRSKEFEWYESNALGRVLEAMEGSASTDSVLMTDGYSWSHFDSFMTAPPQSAFGSLLQEIAQLQQDA